MAAAPTTIASRRCAPPRRCSIRPSYMQAPPDWHLAVSDIKGSTEVVAQGRHGDVNFAAATMIAALVNLCGTIPYQFGGDGAVALVPPQHAETARYRPGPHTAIRQDRVRAGATGRHRAGPGVDGSRRQPSCCQICAGRWQHLCGVFMAAASSCWNIRSRAAAMTVSAFWPRSRRNAMTANHRT